ncbi:MAG: hypothetical protein GW905_05320 [Rhodobacterales bacterium]|nr:hypothetical protein [Rhodobacterales bacterium]
MPDLNLTATRIVRGTWEGVVSRDTGDGAAPQIAVTHLGQPLSGITATADPMHPGQWHVRMPIPAAALSDGVQTFLILDTASDQQIGAFSIAMGDLLEGDIRAEVELLRAELDMLKRAFRRHCVETA